MKYNYSFKEIKFPNGASLKVINVEESIPLVGVFLGSDIQGEDPQYVYDAIDRVMDNKSEYEELNGNVCCVQIFKDKTKIYDNLADDGMGKWCEIETNEFREFVEIWAKERKNKH